MIDPTGVPGKPNSFVPLRVRPGLAELLKAYNYSKQLTRGAWDFAVEIGVLTDNGLSNSEFRWLICKGYVEHARELTDRGATLRTFRRVNSLSFSPQSCFVLTEAGAAAAIAMETTAAPNQPNEIEEVLSGNQPSESEESTPEWDPDRHQLRVGDLVVKQFNVPSPNQETLLTAFEEEGWPPQIDDPLPPVAQVDPKRRLRDTIRGLNRNQKNCVIRFMGDGTGEGVHWVFVQADNVPESESSCL